MAKARNKTRFGALTLLALGTAATITILFYYPGLDGKMGFGAAAVPLFNPVLTYAGMYNGPLYATSEQIGGYPIDAYMANLDRNGVNYFIGMFAIDDESSSTMLLSNDGVGYIADAVQKYPGRIVPFFNPGIGGAEVEPLLGEPILSQYRKGLTDWKKLVGQNLIRGLGEVETQEWKVRHNDPKVLQILNLAVANDIDFMFHPVASKIADVKQLIEMYPNTTFLIHMYREDFNKSRAKLIEIMKSHSNLYFSIDAVHIAFHNGEDFLYKYTSPPGFIKRFDKNYAKMVKDAVRAYEPLVTAVPDKVMWGTEAGPPYSFEPKVYDRLIKISRDVIGRMPAAHQEALAYKNALRVFGEGVTLARPVNVLDMSDWPVCTDSQEEKCDAPCGIKSDADLVEGTPADLCFEQCIITTQRCVLNEDEEDED